MAESTTTSGGSVEKATKCVLEKICVGGKMVDLQVNAVPPTRKVNGKELSLDITLSAEDVGAATMTQVNEAVETAIIGAINASY